jgi:hypothetical protein
MSYAEPRGASICWKFPEPDARLKSHNVGRVRSTKAWRPWKRVLLEEYPDRVTAEKRERYLNPAGAAERLQRFWRGGRVVECGGLENRCGPRAHRGFESHPLRVGCELQFDCRRDSAILSEAKLAELAAGEIISPSPLLDVVEVVTSG